MMLRSNGTKAIPQLGIGEMDDTKGCGIPISRAQDYELIRYKLWNIEGTSVEVSFPAGLFLGRNFVVVGISFITATMSPHAL